MTERLFISKTFENRDICTSRYHCIQNAIIFFKNNYKILISDWLLEGNNGYLLVVICSINTELLKQKYFSQTNTEIRCGTRRILSHALMCFCPLCAVLWRVVARRAVPRATVVLIMTTSSDSSRKQFQESVGKTLAFYLIYLGSLRYQ